MPIPIPITRIKLKIKIKIKTWKDGGQFWEANDQRNLELWEMTEHYYYHGCAASSFTKVRLSPYHSSWGGCESIVWVYLHNNISCKNQCKITSGLNHMLLLLVDISWLTNITCKYIGTVKVYCFLLQGWNTHTHTHTQCIAVSGLISSSGVLIKNWMGNFAMCAQPMLSLRCSCPANRDPFNLPLLMWH